VGAKNTGGMGIGIGRAASFRETVGGMVVIRENPDGSQVTEDSEGIYHGDWSSDEFDCLSQIVPSCLLGCFLPCVLLTQIGVRLGKFNASSYLCLVVIFGLLYLLAYIFVMTSAAGSPIFLLVGLIFFLVGGAFPTVFLRYHLRQKFNIKGAVSCDGCCTGLVGDCCCSICCNCCVLAQMSRHLKSHGQDGECAAKAFQAPEPLALVV